MELCSLHAVYLGPNYGGGSEDNDDLLQKILFQQYKRRLHGHHQMVNTEIRLIIFFTAKDGEALDSQQKPDWELTVAQVMNTIYQIQT